MFEQTIQFFQEWGPVMVLLLFVILAMAADLFPKLASFMREVELRYPQTLEYLNGQEQYVIERYDQLPARIKAGFALVGGKRAWSWLVRSGYAYLRRKQKRE